MLCDYLTMRAAASDDVSYYYCLIQQHCVLRDFTENRTESVKFHSTVRWNCWAAATQITPLFIFNNAPKPAKSRTEPRINQTLGLQESKSGLQEISTPGFVYLYWSVHTSVFLLERRWFSFQILLCHLSSHTNHQFEIRIDVVFAQFWFLWTTTLWNGEARQRHFVRALYIMSHRLWQICNHCCEWGQKVTAGVQDGATKSGFIWPVKFSSDRRQRGSSGGVTRI